MEHRYDRMREKVEWESKEQTRKLSQRFSLIVSEEKRAAKTYTAEKLPNDDRICRLI